MGEIRRLRTLDRRPKVSVIIPSLDGNREGNVGGLFEDLERQTEQDFEVILAVGYKPNGHARNQGVAAARGEYIVCIDDDVRLGHERVLDQLVRAFSEHEGLGMTGPAQLLPRDSSPFQVRAARETSRTECPVVNALTDSDFVTHMCLCMPTELYKKLGWESDTLPRGTDPDLRRRVRAAGYRIAVVPDCWAYHPMPPDLKTLLRMTWRNGAGSAWVQRFHPEMCIDTPDGHVPSAGDPKPLPLRALRFAAAFLRRVVTLQYIGLIADLTYLGGYAYGYVTGRDGLRSGAERAAVANSQCGAR